MKYKTYLWDANLYTLQHPSSGLEPSLIIKKLRLFPVTIILYPVVCKRLFIFKFICISIKNLLLFAKNITESNQHKVVNIIECKYSSYMTILLNIKVNVARTCILLPCVEIIYLGLKEPKFKHEEILVVPKIVFLHENTNLPEKKNE